MEADDTGSEHDTPLVLASLAGKTEVVEILIEKGAESTERIKLVRLSYCK
jgi:ankyrin repeat protein